MTQNRSLKAALVSIASVVASGSCIADDEADARIRMTVVVARMIKEASRNPSTFEMIDASSNKTATTVCMTYRAQNGFGGMNVEKATMHNGKFAFDAKTWNRRCTKEAMFDTTKARHFVK